MRVRHDAEGELLVHGGMASEVDDEVDLEGGGLES